VKPHPFAPDALPSHLPNLQKEWAILCSYSSPNSTTADLTELFKQEFDWNVLLDLAENHGVQGLLAYRFKETDFGGVPRPAREKLQSRMRAQHLFTLSMTAELFRILQSFSEAKIDTVLVKGPLISYLAYSDPAVRSYVDLDLIVRDRDIQAATQRMLQMGFSSDVPLSAMRAGKIPGEYLFRREGTQHIVELHTEHTFRYYPKPMRIEELFARSRCVMLDGREIPALSLEDELVLNCIHGAKHFWERLMWVSDIAAVVTRHPEIDWNKARNGAAEVGAVRMLRVGLLLSSMLLGTELPSSLAPEIQADRGSEKLCRNIQTWLPYAGAAPPSLPKRAAFRREMAGGGLPGTAYLMRLSLSPTQEDWAKGAEERRSWFGDAVRRPFRLFRKYGSNE
jgi:Uncharacterised nucleotidyltransferase